MHNAMALVLPGAAGVDEPMFWLQAALSVAKLAGFVYHGFSHFAAAWGFLLIGGWVTWDSLRELTYMAKARAVPAYLHIAPPAFNATDTVGTCDWQPLPDTPQDERPWPVRIVVWLLTTIWSFCRPFVWDGIYRAINFAGPFLAITIVAYQIIATAWFFIAQAAAWASFAKTKPRAERQPLLAMALSIIWALFWLAGQVIVLVAYAPITGAATRTIADSARSLLQGTLAAITGLGRLAAPAEISPDLDTALSRFAAALNDELQHARETLRTEFSPGLTFGLVPAVQFRCAVTDSFCVQQARGQFVGLQNGAAC